MKITQGPQNYIPSLDTAQKKTAKGVEKTSQTTKPGDAFNVQLSSAVEQMKKGPQESDEVRLDKVEAIRKQLASGTYNISGKDVANKILNVLKG